MGKNRRILNGHAEINVWVIRFKLYACRYGECVCAACVIYVEQMATISQANNTLAADARMPFQCITAVERI